MATEHVSAPREAGSPEQKRSTPAGAGSGSGVLALQRTAGNRAVAALVAQRLADPPQVQRGRIHKTRYNQVPYNRSKFRFIRWRRRILDGYITKAKAGVNLLTVKYKKDGQAYYLTTRSVPNTAGAKFALGAGHSEQRFGALRDRFMAKHKLKTKHFRWAATEREPCGHGPGLANCRHTLAGLGIPDNKVYFCGEYVEGEDMRTDKKEKPSEINKLAEDARKTANDKMELHITKLDDADQSETESEDESNVHDEYESDYEADETQKRRKTFLPKKRAGRFREGKPK